MTITRNSVAASLAAFALASPMACATASAPPPPASSTSASTQTVAAPLPTESGLPDYAPLLESTKARAQLVDPKKGYVVPELKPGVYLIADGG